MGLVNRLAGIPEAGQEEQEVVKIPVEPFWANLYELSEGEVNKAQIVALFSLDTQEESDLDWLIGKYNAQPNAAAKAKFVEIIRVIFVLAEAKQSGYTTNADIVARINAI